MAKIYGLFGTLTGKLADTVMSVRNGEQIARKYQPVVFNPSTPAQVETRAKLKLLSQLSAVLGKTIAIPREGNVSSRNLFTKFNYPLVSYADNTAEIELAAVQITKSSVGFPAIQAARTGVDNKSLAVLLSTGVDDFDRVVYIAIAHGADNKLRFAGSAVVNDAGVDKDFPGSINIRTTDAVTVLAYGVRDNTENARARFGNIEVLTAQTVADLVVTRTVLESDVTLSETVGINVVAAASNAKEPEETKKKK